MTNQIAADMKRITKMLEGMGKRLRKVEVIARPVAETVDTFLELQDTPDEYAGRAGWAALVNNNEDGLTFAPIGGACVTFICGSIGWRAYGGGTVRTLVHENAFQLTADGDDRGTDAIDLQITQFNDTYVAAAPTSAILTNEENKIEADCSYSVIIGTWNEIKGNSDFNYVIGWSNDVDTNSNTNEVFGGGNDLDDANYNTVLGINHDVSAALGNFIFGEDNNCLGNVNDDVTYCFQGGILNDLAGDCFEVFQWGEDNKAYALGSVSAERVHWSAQFGYRTYLQNVETNFLFGQGVKSSLANADASGEYYHGRLAWSGDYPNDVPTDGTGEVGGFNQNSLFSQNDVITTWASSWTTARFEFPIIQDSVWYFTAMINCTERGCANTNIYKIEGAIENDGGTTTLLGTPTVTNVYRDVATKEWQVVADDTNDRLAFQYRDTAGPDATWTNVQLMLMTCEVGAEV